MKRLFLLLLLISTIPTVLGDNSDIQTKTFTNTTQLYVNSTSYVDIYNGATNLSISSKTGTVLLYVVAEARTNFSNRALNAKITSDLGEVVNFNITSNTLYQTVPLIYPVYVSAGNHNYSLSFKVDSGSFAQIRKVSFSVILQPNSTNFSTIVVEGSALDNLNWTNITNYPSGCSDGQAVRVIGDIPTCEDNLQNTTVGTKESTWDTVTTKETLSNKSTDTNLGTSDTLYPSQKAVKTYTDTKTTLDEVNASAQIGEAQVTNLVTDLNNIRTNDTNQANYLNNTFPGSSFITTLGTIVSGIWHGTSIEDAYIGSSTLWNSYQTTKWNKTDSIPEVNLTLNYPTHNGSQQDTNLTNHTDLNGTSVHGLGNVSTQNFGNEFLGWDNLTGYPSGCTNGKTISTILDSPTCIEPFNSTYDNASRVITYNVSSFQVQSGTLDTSGLLTNLSTRNNVYENISEANGASPLTVQFNFTIVPTFTSILTYLRYVGGATHHYQVEINQSGTWVSVGEFTTESDFRYFSFPVYEPSNKINNGVVEVRFRHVESGNSAHDLFIDYIVLQNGGAVGAGIMEHGVLTGLLDDDHPQYTLNTTFENLNTSAERFSNKSSDTNLGTSDNLYPTQNAVKTYADTKEPAISQGVSPQFWMFNKTWQNITTSWITEGVNLWFTNARAISAVQSILDAMNTSSAANNTASQARDDAINITISTIQSNETGYDKVDGSRPWTGDHNAGTKNLTNIYDILGQSGVYFLKNTTVFCSANCTITKYANGSILIDPTGGGGGITSETDPLWGANYSTFLTHVSNTTMDKNLSNYSGVLPTSSMPANVSYNNSGFIVRVYNSTQSPNLINGAYTKLSFNTKSIDTDNLWNTTTNNFTSPCNCYIDVSLEWLVVNSTVINTAQFGFIYKNGLLVSSMESITVGNGQDTQVKTSDVIPTNIGDTIEIYARSVSGNNEVYTYYEGGKFGRIIIKFVRLI